MQRCLFKFRSAAQQKRVGQKRLDASLAKLADHPCWGSSLGICSHLGALKPELVDDEIEAEHALQQLQSCFGFSYLEDACPNPVDGNPSLFQSCCEKHPGICKSSQFWGKTLKLVQQLEIELENLDVSSSTSSTLISLSISCSKEEYEIAKPLHSSWHMLGCVSKRPLCHILGSLQWKRIVSGGAEQSVLVPCYSEAATSSVKHWTLKTSYEAAYSPNLSFL